ncbi:lysophospholipid acyltransferase family protein [Actinopolymorpha singaporensis]|uniref:lysophospholipid acyltransferase family protein n=1 Tax=Actinopolymorpha singaporensis TaxID=117157 RepID=UPI001F51A5A7|nr:lysophospholipid acyltransferase family protein [Actinopolymorpha singaporensis]
MRIDEEDSVPLPRTGRAYDIAAGVIRPTMLAFTRREWRGGEHVPREGGFIAVTNHLSYFDPIALGHFLHEQGRAVRFLAKASLFDVPLVGRFLRSAGQIPVHREKRTAGDALKEACQAVERGECVVVYPEGTITRDPGLWPMVGKTGAVRIALRTGCEIVPIAQWGAQEVLLPYAKVPRLLPRKTMRMQAGPAFDLSAYRDVPFTPTLLKKATNELMDVLTRMVAGLRHEAPPAVRFDPGKTGLPSIGNPYKRRVPRK